MNPSILDILNPLDTKRLRESFLGASPYPFVVIDDFLDRDFALEVSASYPTFESATGLGRQFSNLHERQKVQVTDSSLFPEPVARLDAMIASEAFLKQVSEITDIPDLLHDPSHDGGGMHVHGPGGALDVHVDFNVLQPAGLHRRLNVIIYLTPDWDERWGGCFETWDPDVKINEHTVAPRFNRCVMFRTSETSFHGVTEVSGPPGTLRRSFSTFLYTEEPPPWWTGQGHDTIYRARPNERFKNAVQMPIKQAKDRFKRSKRAAKDRIKGWLFRK